MKLSELQKEIDKFIQKHGDLDACIIGPEDGRMHRIMAILKAKDFGTKVAFFNRFNW